MFTGIVSDCVQVLAVERRGTGLWVRLENPWRPVPGRAGDPVVPGESISVSGCCLTAVPAAGEPPGGPIGSELCFDLSAETLSRTWFSELAPGRILNLERSVRLSDRLGGHLVSGHVDGTGEILAVADSGDGGRRFGFRAPAAVERYLLDKGSVTIDGVSLTVVDPRGACFDVAVIPATLAATSLGRARAGERVHLEADLVGKWIEKLVPGGAPGRARTG